MQKAFQRREWDEDLPEKENGIMIPDVGSFEYGEPRISTTAGLVPVVISGVAKEWSPEDIETEIRLENADRWGLPTEVASSPEAFRQHVRCDQRLNRRSESHGKVTWLPSNAIRCWVTPAIWSKIQEEGDAIRFDYQIKEVRKYAMHSQSAQKRSSTK